MGLKQANLVILTSSDGENWHMLKPEEVPEWVRQPDIVGHLVDGEMCMDPRQEPKGSPWYRAEIVPVEH